MRENKKYVYICSPKTTVLGRESGRKSSSRDRKGEVPEWSIGPHSKCGVQVTVPGVRIPLSPPGEAEYQQNAPKRPAYKAGRFSFSGPAHATAPPASDPGVPIIPGVPIVSTVSGRTDREERREMPRIGPFVWERPIAESSVFCNLRRFYRFAAKIHAQSQAGGLSFAGFRNTLFP